MIIRTAITNNLSIARQVKWAGVHLQPGETRVLEGAYPYCSKKHRAEDSFKSEIEDGTTSVVYITEMPVMTNEEYGQKVAAEKAKEAQEAKEADVEVEETEDAGTDEVEDTPETEETETEETEDDDVFEKASIEDRMKETRQMPGIETTVVEEGAVAQAARAIGADVEVVKTEDAPEEKSEELIGDVATVGSDTVPATVELSSSAQKLVDEEGLTAAQVAEIEATGKDGSVIKADVQRYLKAQG